MKAPFKYAFLFLSLFFPLVFSSCISTPYTATVDGLILLSKEASNRGAVKKIVGFESRFLDLKRNLYVYTPPGYETAEDRYPVIYMMDGNNLFNKYASRGHNWRLELVLDNLISAGLLSPVIVVGIGNTENRTGEYVPYDLPGPKAPDDKGLKAPELLKSLVEELNPQMDLLYRTRPERQHTTISGSSYGGTFAVWAGLRHPKVFGRVMAFSPAFWPAEGQLFKDLTAADLTDDQQWYIDLGGGDGPGNWAREMMDQVDLHMAEALPAGNYRSAFDPQAPHKEETWTQRFPDALMGFR